MKNRFTYIQFNKSSYSTNETNGNKKVGTGFWKSQRLVVVVGLCAVVLLSGLQVTLSAHLATTGERIKQLEDERSMVLLEIGNLEKQLAESASLPRIEQKAKSELGMVPLTSAKDSVYYLTEYSDSLLAAR